jgi:hypothetical protein
MNNNLEFENEDPSPDSIEDNHPRTNYGQGYYEEPKQETLEEDVEIELGKLAIQNSKRFASKSEVDYTLGFIQGAKWQAERMYSEEKCYKTLHNLMQDITLQGLIIMDDIDLKKWFKQNKKKIT